MRKRTLSNISDYLFWFIVAILPLCVYLVQCISYDLTSASEVLPTFLQFMQNFGISTDSVIYTALTQIFGSEGILPFFTSDNNTVLLFLSYFVTVEIVHLAVDFLLFIPRLSHKWMESLTQNK